MLRPITFNKDGEDDEVGERLRHLRQAQLRTGGEARLQAEEAAGKRSCFVILSEAKNLFSIEVQSTERFFGEMHASE